MWEEVLQVIFGLSFRQALIIVLGVLFSDTVVGLMAAKSSGRHIKSSIMVACQDKKVKSFFKYIIIATALYIAADGNKALETSAVIVVIYPVIPEVISLIENIKIIFKKTDTKPKEDSSK